MTHLKDKEIIKNLGITQEDLEDSRRREDLANQQLREREKLASRTGVSSKRAGEILKDKSRAEIQELERARTESERKSGAVDFLDESGFLLEERPQTGDVDLDLKREGFGEQLPLVGASIAATGINRPKPGSGGFAIRQFLGLSNEDAEFQTIIQDPTTKREMELQIIQQEVLDKGITDSERLGIFVEAIPIIGTSIDRWVGEIGETPGQNVRTMIAETKKIASDATNTREKVLTGKINREVGLDELNRMENEMARLQQRIKLMSQHSKSLQADGDQLNLMETEILDTQQRIFDAKESVALGLITPASDASIDIELAQLKKERRSNNVRG